MLKMSGLRHKYESTDNPIQKCVFCLCLRVCVQAQLSVSEQEIQEMIRQRIRKMEEIRMSVTELEVEQTHS